MVPQFWTTFGALRYEKLSSLTPEPFFAPQGPRVDLGTSGEPAVAETIRLRSDIDWQDLEGEVVALDLASGAYLSLNGTGSVLWPLLAEGATEARMVTALTSRFPVEAVQARADVHAFVDRLRALALVDEPE